jgi:hypothetical protein
MRWLMVSRTPSMTAAVRSQKPGAFGGGAGRMTPST